MHVVCVAICHFHCHLEIQTENCHVGPLAVSYTSLAPRICAHIHDPGISISRYPLQPLRKPCTRYRKIISRSHKFFVRIVGGGSCTRYTRGDFCGLSSLFFGHKCFTPFGMPVSKRRHLNNTSPFLWQLILCRPPSQFPCAVSHMAFPHRLPSILILCASPHIPSVL